MHSYIGKDVTDHLHIQEGSSFRLHRSNMYSLKELKELLFYISYKRISGIHYICEALKGDNENVYLSVTRDKNYRENIINNTRSVQG